MADKWGRRVGVGYVVAVLGFTGLTVFTAWGVPGLRQVFDGQVATGNRGLFTALAVGGLVVLGYAAWRRTLTTMQAWMVGAVALWLGATALALPIHGALSDGRFAAVTAIGCGLVAAGSLIDWPTLVRLMTVLGWFYGWGSVAAGLSSLLFGWPTVLISDERYRGWLGLLGIDVESFGALNGVTPGRVYVGLTCGLLLIFSVRASRGTRPPWLMWAGLVVACAWALSRTGAVVIVLGLVCALLPWERWSVGWLIAAVFTVILLPVSLSGFLSGQGVSDGTTAWRFDLWQDYLTRPGMWTPFGIGAQPASIEYADHAHNQLLEAQATGGWFATVGVVSFVVLAALAAWRSAGWDHRSAIAVLFGAAAIFQVDVVTFSNNYASVNNALVLVLTLLSAAAARPPALTTASAPLPRTL